ncbi:MULTISPECIES: RNA polymerase sigma factor [Sphingobacterium]|uniref:RNA polymerase sigma factor n=1 Tax=Sphingobacterium populi TaxID=1812824 RepID=A0ABW5UEC4_9SPHI|nr:sigma-70 family RNA polymerase sigma factor [Sphingobacterium sp. CFCC 11742]
MSPITHLSEETLISLLQKRDRRAFNYLYDSYSGALYGVVIRIVLHKNYADEVIQDVFVKIWNNIEQFDKQKGRVYTWMLNIARNAAIDYIKSKGVKNEQKNQSLPDVVNRSESSNYAVTEPQEKTDLIGLQDVINKLKPEWRKLIDLAYYQGYTQKEIAEELDLPIGTVKTRVRAALLQLKVVLNEYQ